MRATFARVGIAAALAAAILTGAMATRAQTGEPSAQQHLVRIQNLEFIPPELTVAPGDTIVWINDDLVPHTVTADDGSWGSDELGTGAEWRVIVAPSTSQSYFCAYHPIMAARLQIVERTATR